MPVTRFKQLMNLSIGPFGGNNLTHVFMRVPGEPVLKSACYGVTESSEAVPGARHSFERIFHLAGIRTDFEQEALFALLHMKLSCRVEKPKAIRRIDDFKDPAEVKRPKPESVSFHRYDLACDNPSCWICNKHPSEIKHFPTLERAARFRERRFAATDAGLREIARERDRQSSDYQAALDR